MRQLVRGAVYHVTSRVVNKEFYLARTLAKDLFLEVLAKARWELDFGIDNFVVMENHFHILIRPEGTELPVIMKWIKGIYTLSFNRIYGRRDSLWGSRYFSRSIRGFAEYSHVYRYIDLNPVKAALVTLPYVWTWSGAAHHFAKRRDVVSASPAWRGLVHPESLQILMLP